MTIERVVHHPKPAVGQAVRSRHRHAAIYTGRSENIVINIGNVKHAIAGYKRWPRAVTVNPTCYVEQVVFSYMEFVLHSLIIS
jgi:hypothetical protein